MYLSVTPHIQPTHTGRDKDGTRHPTAFQASSSYDVETDTETPIDALIDNFTAAIRTDTPRKLNCEVAEGHKSTLLCHLGNIAQRTGQALTCRASDGHIIGNDKAAGLWERDYQEGWKPVV